MPSMSSTSPCGIPGHERSNHMHQIGSRLACPVASPNHNAYSQSESNADEPTKGVLESGGGT